MPAQPETDWDVVPVFYGTDRVRKDEPKRIAYTAERARRLELGRALVTVPKSHQVPNIERPFAIRVPFINITIYEQAEDPKQHFTIRELKSLTREQFLALARERIGGSTSYKDQAVVFVHGYNTTFDYALFRTAQMAYDLKFDGASFLYSWPSGAGFTGYGYDRESSEQAEPYLREYIELVVKETGAKSVSVIAHSMGNMPLLRVLQALGPSLPPGVQLNQIILAAPDVDRNLFENLAANIKQYGRGVTLYCSSNDRAMAAARRVAGGIPRAGDVPADGPIVLAGIDTIDVSQTSTDYLALNHSSYAEKSALLNDIGLLLQTGRAAAREAHPHPAAHRHAQGRLLALSADPAVRARHGVSPHPCAEEASGAGGKLATRRDAEQLAIAALALGRDRDGARAVDAADPALREGVRAQRGTDGAGQMRAPLAPVEARAAQHASPAAAARRHGIDVDAELAQQLHAGLGHQAAVASPAPPGRRPPGRPPAPRRDGRRGGRSRCGRRAARHRAGRR